MIQAKKCCQQLFDLIIEKLLKKFYDSVKCFVK